MRAKIFLKRRIGQLYASLNARDLHRKLVLLYHSIGGGAEATAIEAFRDHLNVIAAIGQVLPLQDLLSTTASRSVAVAITFDDGYATLRDHAAPILADFGCGATAFLSVGEIADTERRPSRVEDGYYRGEQFLTWRDVDALRVAGWRIGSHGVRHLNLVRADAATVANELSGSKQVIEQHLGTICDMFAYTWGRTSPSLRAAVRATGYRYGFAGDHAPLTAQSDPFSLPRVNIANEYTAEDLAAILRGDWDYLHWVLKAKAVTH